MVHTYPGLPPIRWVKARQAKKITEDDAEMPEDRQEDSSNWKIVLSFVMDKNIEKKRPGMAHIKKNHQFLHMKPLHGPSCRAITIG